MAIALSKHVNGRSGNRRIVTVDITLDSSYPAGGYLLKPAQIGLVEILDASLKSGGRGQQVEYDFDNFKIKVFASNGTEIAAATSLATVKIRAKFEGF